MAVDKSYKKKGRARSHGEIRQVARLMNMSDEGVRIYAKKGLVYPEVNEESNYRSFDIMDFVMLMYSRVYRKSDFSLKEIETIVNGSDLKTIQKMYRQKIAEKENEILQAQRLVECMQDVADSMEQIPALLGKCEISPFPGLYRIEFMKDGNMWQNSPEMSSLISDWTNYAPCTMVSSRYNVEKLCQGIQPETSASGLGMLAKYGSRYEVTGNSLVSFAPPCDKALHTILVADNTQLIPNMKYISDFLQVNRLVPNGDAVTLGFVNTNFDTTFTRYFHLWIPLA